MKNITTWLRICYWLGAIADAGMAFAMLRPELFLRFMRVNLAPDVNLRYGLMIGAPLMFGWTCLLLWADRKPFERKGVLPLTVLVLLGYVIVRLYAIATGLGSLERIFPLFIQQIGLIALFLFSYFKATHQGE